MSYNNPNMAIIKAVKEQNLSVAEAAKKFNRSRQWIYKLLKRYDQGGPRLFCLNPKPQK